MLQPLNEADLDFAYSEGLLVEWLKDAPAQVKDCLSNLMGGIASYRERFIRAQEMAEDLQGKYNTLTATSAQYLQKIQEQKGQIDELLIEQQKDIQVKYIETP